MRFISIKIHGILDYITVIGFAAAPSIFGLSGIPAYLAYALSLVHLLMTVLTDFPFGFVKVLPVKLHQIVETTVGPVLIASPWLLGFSGDETAKKVFIVAGAIIIVVGLTTKYAQGAAPSMRPLP